MKNGDWYRALIVDGNHRVAALAACGYEKVQLRFDYKFPSVVDIENVLYWPCVKLGIYTPDIASKIFLSYFEDSGITKASQFGLLR